MKRVVGIAALAATTALACGSAVDPAPSAETRATPSDAPASPTPPASPPPVMGIRLPRINVTRVSSSTGARGAEDLVKALYSPYEMDGTNMIGLEALGCWTAGLQALIDRDIDEHPGEVGRLDFDPVIQGQDWQAVRVTSTHTKRTKGGFQIEVDFLTMGTPHTGTYDLVDEGGFWRVDDIHRGSWSLREILLAPAP